MDEMTPDTLNGHGTGAASSVDHGAAADPSQALIRRAPSGYLWNQAYFIWFSVSTLLFEVVLFRSLPLSQANDYVLVSTAAANVGFYLASLGLSSAGTVYIPRALTEGGPGHAMALAVRLVVTRLAAVIVVDAVFLWGLNGLADGLATSGVPFLVGWAHDLNASVLVQHRVVIATYVFGVGLANLLGALLVALLRTRIVFIVGSMTLLVQLLLVYLLVHALHWGIDGAVVAQSVPSALSALAYAIALTRVLPARPAAGGRRLLGPALQLGVASWLADLPSTSLMKSFAIGQLAAVAPYQQAFFERSYQMGDAGNYVLTEGLGGVSMAVMSAAYGRRHMSPLATVWRTVCKLQALFAAPLVAFAVPHASVIMRVLFGAPYAAAGSFLALFLLLNLLVQLMGASTNDWALYVLGRQRWVVVARWAAVGVLALSGVFLVPRYHIVGALLAVGLGRLTAQIFLLTVARRLIGQPFPAGFVLRVLAALLIPTAVGVLWRPNSLVGLVASGLIFIPLFLICLRIVRPLDAEDGMLLNQVAAPLRAILRPFVAPARGAAVASSNAAGGALPPLVTAAPSGPLAAEPRDPSPEAPR